MTATDELKRLLDQRRIGYQEYHSQATGSMEPTTKFYLQLGGHDTYGVIESGMIGDVLLTLRCTPAQAVDAVAGRGESREVIIDNFFTGCSECGYIWDYMKIVGDGGAPMFCPSCGRRVSDD